MNNKNLLFYLKECPTCLKFMQLCQNNNILQKFELICIDGKIKYFVSKGINVVPTITVAGYTKPFVGKEVFVWLNTILNMNKPLQYGTAKDTQNINKPADIFSIKATPPPPITKNSAVNGACGASAVKPNAFDVAAPLVENKGILSSPYLN